jgi:hypothetical protein
MLIDLERVLQRALASDSPLEILREAAKSLPPEDRTLIEQIETDGFLLTSLLVHKLRFEKICRGDDQMEEWFEREPGRFTEFFRKYNRDVPPLEVFPRQEAAAFRAYLTAKGHQVP